MTAVWKARMEKRIFLQSEIRGGYAMKKDARIYVAGSSGVAGSAIVRLLEREGYHNLLLPKHTELDLSDQWEVDAFFRWQRPEYVFFTAVKMGSIVYRKEHPADIQYENLAMQAHIIRAAHQYGVKKLLFMSSDFIYPDTGSGTFSEADFLSGKLPEKDLPYTLAKISGIKLCDYYRQQYGDDFFTVVPCAFFGINSSFDLERANVIGALIRRFYEAKCAGADELVLWGSGKPVKEFLYSEDIASACVFLMKNDTTGGIINIGAGDGGHSIMEAAQIIQRVTGFEGAIGCDLTKPDGILRRVMDSSKLRALGWTPSYSFEQAVQLTYEHFLKTPYAG